jgi:hypothetical protein
MRAWQHNVADNYRRSVGIPQTVSDETIFSFWSESYSGGMDEADIIQFMREELAS